MCARLRWIPSRQVQRIGRRSLSRGRQLRAGLLDGLLLFEVL